MKALTFWTLWLCSAPDAGLEHDAGVAAVPDAGTPQLRGLEVAWDREGLHTGRAELLLIQVSPDASPIQTLEGTFARRKLVVLPASPDRRRFYALAAVDIEHKPGPAPLSLRAVLKDGSQLAFDKPVPVVDAPYETSVLSVDKRFIHPRRKDALRAAREGRVLDAVLKQISSERLWRGSFSKPARGEETSAFGTRRTYNKKTRSRHFGWDLDGAVGDPVTATARGRVVLSAERFYSGGTVVIDHGQGLFSMYFHMSRRDVRVGELVEKGQGIGLVGKSGRVTGPHLHFTVKLAGENVDPKFLLALDLSADAEDHGPAPAPPAPPSAGAQTREPVVEPGHVEEQQGNVPEVHHVP